MVVHEKTSQRVPLSKAQRRRGAAAPHAAFQPPQKRSAWAFSGVLHLLLLLIVGWWWSGPVPLESPEVDRRGAIVLVQDEARETPQYFTQQDATAPAEAHANEAQLEAVQEALPDGSAMAVDELLPPVEAVAGSSASHLPTALDEGGRAGRNLPSAIDLEALLAAEPKPEVVERPAGPPTRISFFGSAAAQGHSFLFLLDRSGSMGGRGLGALGAAERELHRVLDQLSETHTFQIAAYNQTPVYLERDKMLPATEENKARAKQFMADLVAFAGTDHYAALLSAVRRKPDVIFLLTDGDSPRLNALELRQLERLTAGRTNIHCIHVGSGPRQQRDHFLEHLARRTGGSYVYVDMLGWEQ